MARIEKRKISNDTRIYYEYTVYDQYDQVAYQGENEYTANSVKMGLVDEENSGVQTNQTDRTYSTLSKQDTLNAEDQKEDELAAPINFTDPFVYHDPIINSSTVTRLYQPMDSASQDGFGSSNEPYETVNVEGTEYPIIKFNNSVIEPYMINYMRIDYDYNNFCPELTLIIYDINNTLSFSDVPGPNNVITVILVPANRHVYKNISIDFYIDSCEFDKIKQSIQIHATYKFLPFEKTISQAQIKYGGCNNSLGRVTGVHNEIDGVISCNKGKNRKPNMWETLHEICLETGLGFASTDHVKDIEDRLPRVINKPMTFKDYILSQIEMAGVDENSIFDCWIDLYRYLVIVNVPYVMTVNVSPNNLAIKSRLGVHGTDKNVPEARTQLVHRTLTNYNSLGDITDLSFIDSSFEEIVDNSQKYDGYTKNISSLLVKGGSSNANNSINQIDITREPDSIDDMHKEDYETIVTTNCTNRVDMEYDTNLQKEIRKSYFKKQRGKRYKLTLERPNYGLNRGTLVNISYFTTDAKEKNLIIKSGSNFTNPSNTNIEPDHLPEIDGKTERDIISNEAIPFPVVQKNGIYYIDGMTFEYSYDTKEIIHTLYLIKRGNKSNLNNKYTMPRIDIENSLHNQ